MSILLSRSSERVLDGGKLFHWRPALLSRSEGSIPMNQRDEVRVILNGKFIDSRNFLVQ